MLWNVTTAEYLHTGHMACPGCGASLSLRHALKMLGEQTIVVMPACCTSIIVGGQPTTAVSVPLIHVPFATAAACASGVRRALLAQGRQEVTVMVWAGDGGTFDIGLQAISGAAERHEDFLYVCYDNEAYMNTGIQRSSATPPGAWTTTTPAGKELEYEKKDIISIIKAHRPSYLATATIAYPEDFMAKFAKAKKLSGFRFLHLLAACPAGWKLDSSASLEVTRLAVETGMFPLLEQNEDNELQLTYVPKTYEPLASYFRIQGRYKNLTDEQINFLQGEVRWRNKKFLTEKGETCV
ncbi:MAG TPA: pyruvate synthase subunit beta [Proteobacteria bacterium]|nr:pyruvate synthase subunit beta [Pseudomonadota bacterium]